MPDRAPTPDRFRALSRSAAWRWRSARFTYRDHYDPTGSTTRIWVQRPAQGGPAQYRQEELGGRLIAAAAIPFRSSTSWLVISERGGSGAASPGIPQSFHWLDPRAPRPEFDADGLVRRRPTRFPAPGSRYAAEFDDPMVGNYRFVAALDPVEIGGVDENDRIVAVDEVREVGHAGRPTWEAILRPTDDYDPRCSCCALLPGEVADRIETEALNDGTGPRPRDYPHAYRVGLDVATGMCVYAEQLGGSENGRSHLIEIEETGAAYPDEFFREPRRSGIRRFLRRR